MIKTTRQTTRKKKISKIKTLEKLRKLFKRVLSLEVGPQEIDMNK